MEDLLRSRFIQTVLSADMSTEPTEELSRQKLWSTAYSFIRLPLLFFIGTAAVR